MSKPVNTALSAKICEWDQQKGFGFLQHGKSRVFLHWRDFAVKHRRPVVGDVVTFVMGKDPKGRPCAKQAVQVETKSRVSLFVWGVLMILLITPTFALFLQGVNLLYAGLYVAMMSTFSYWAYAKDKMLAQEQEWRTPEAQLQMLDMLGGWPGGFLAQQRLRHKCSKGPYQFIFWLFVGLYQFLAVDSLRGWPLIRSVFGM